LQPVQDVRGRCAEARIKFLGTRSPADLGSGFEHQHLAAGLRQHCRADQAVMAAADDYCIK
jgi:hypothetical protein